MTDLERRKSASKLILKNLAKLIEGAGLLANRKQYGPAVHLIMAAREEAAKWLVLYCWDYLDQRIKGRLYNHLLKHELVGLFYYLSGKMQATEFASAGLALLARRDPQMRRDTTELAAHMMKELNPRDPKGLAVDINHFMFGIDRSAYERSHKDSIKLTERKRTASIYVDFGKDFSVDMSPMSFKLRDYKAYKRDIILAQFYIDELSGKRPNKKILYRLFPEWGVEFRKSIGNLKRKLDAVREDEVQRVPR